MRKLLALLTAGTVVVLGAAPAFADVNGAITAFKNGKHVYADSVITNSQLSGSEVASAINDDSVYVVVLASGQDPQAAATRIAEAISGRQLAVAVVSGTKYYAGSETLCKDQAASAIDSAVTAHKSELQSGSLTGMLTDFVDNVTSVQAGDCASTGQDALAADANKSSGKTGTIVLLVIVALIVVGAGYFVVSRKRKRRQELADLRTDVTALYDRLGADVSNLDPKDNDVARQALADASERYTATGSQLAQADSASDFAVARRTALEGLYAARTARKELGLPEGPELPPLNPTSGPALTAPTTVDVKGQQVQGYPDYQPGAPYWFGGGGGYSAGWYAVPFWETMLLTSMIGGGFGGGWGGNNYGDGYQEGYQDAERNQDLGGGGGDFSGGGGDWSGFSGGGGDWGGGGGGGDFGGGGGDFGGGGDGSGSW